MLTVQVLMYTAVPVAACSQACACLHLPATDAVLDDAVGSPA